MQNQKRITLKNLKVADFASEETLCFTATVLFDGMPIAHASNDGHGGATFLHSMPDTRKLLQEAEVFAKSLPAHVTDHPDPADHSRKMIIDITLEYLVDCLAGQIHSGRKLRTLFNRKMRSKVLFCKAGVLFSLNNLKPADIKSKAEFYASLRKKEGADIIILAELSPDEAFALWKRYGVQEV